MNDTRGSVAVVDRQGHRRVLSREWDAVFGLAWAPGGREIWFGRFDGWINAIGATDLAGNQRNLYRSPDGLSVPAAITPEGYLLDPDGVSPDGHFVSLQEQDGVT